MSSEINLLPTELKASKEVMRTSALLTRLTIIIGAILFIAASIGGGYIYYLSRQADQVLEQKRELTRNVTNLESTEQKLILIKDRIAKISNVLAERSDYEALKKYDEIIASLPADANFEEAELDVDVSKLTMLIPSSADLLKVMESVKDPAKYNKVKVISLEFNPTNGYELVLDIL